MTREKWTSSMERAFLPARSWPGSGRGVGGQLADEERPT
jgi:hypothetical protein